MEHRLLVWSIASSLAVLIGASALAYARCSSRSRPAGLTGWMTALIVTLVGFALTLPTQAPFSTGQMLGRGFLLGGLAALISGTAALWLARTTARDALAAVPLAAGAAVSLYPLLGLRASLLDALMGVAIGWLTASALLLMADRDAEEGSDGRVQILLGAGFVATLCALEGLGELRSYVAFGAGWRLVSLGAVGGALAAVVPAALLLRSAVQSPLRAATARMGGRLPVVAQQRLPVALSAALALLLLPAAARLLGDRMVHAEPILRIVVAGLATGLIAWWTAASSAGSAGAPGARPVWMSAGLGALVCAAAVMAAFQMLAGVGVGVLLLAAWLVAAMAAADSEDEVAGRVLSVVMFGTLLLLYRLCSARFANDVDEAQITDHYALFGTLVGVLLPTYLASTLANRLPAAAAALRIALLAIAGVLSVAVPGVILLLWGARCTLALITGLALAAALIPLAATRATSADAEAGGAPVRLPALTALFALASGLAICQWTGIALPLADLTRAQKVHMLEWTAIGIAAILLLSDLAARWKSGQRPQEVAARTGAAAR